mgnify:CR=1 FL=1
MKVKELMAFLAKVDPDFDVSLAFKPSEDFEGCLTSEIMSASINGNTVQLNEQYFNDECIEEHLAIVFYEAGENCGGSPVEHDCFYVRILYEDRLITVEQAKDGDESILKDMEHYSEFKRLVWKKLENIIGGGLKYDI